MQFVMRLRMRQTESLHVAIHVAKGTKSDGGSWEIREYYVIFGCFLSLRQEKRVQTYGIRSFARRSRMPLTLTTYGILALGSGRVSL